MAAALIGGMIERGFAATDILVVELDAERREWLKTRFGVNSVAAPDERVFASDVLMLAVKPQQMKAALTPFAGKLRNTLVISIAAGLRLADIGRWLGQGGASCERLVRCMPNTPALIGAGITGMYAAPAVDARGRETAAKILAATGGAIWVDDEARLDAVTGISGSGPAYVFHFIEALEAAAGWHDALVGAASAASARSRELGEQLGKD
jgi:pyrroline-5-carboxylate reductase